MITAINGRRKRSMIGHEKPKKEKERKGQADEPLALACHTLINIDK